MAAQQQQGSSSWKQEEVDPEFKWVENPSGYTLTLTLKGFKKEDFRVQVDGAGRLTVRGQRPGGGADVKPTRFHKVFQLPPTANLDQITGRFDASVLTLTMPKRSATIEEIKRPKEERGGTKPKEEEDDVAKKPTSTKPPPLKPKEEDAKKEEEVPRKVQQQQQQQQQQRKEEVVEEAKRPKQEQEQKPTVPVLAPAVEEVVAKPKAEAPAPPVPTPVVSMRKDKVPPLPKAKEAPTPAEAKTEPASSSVDRESVAGRMRQCAEKRAKVVTEEAEQERKAARSNGWRERVVGELEELADMKWADGLVEAAKKNKEVIATAVAAFSLGFLVSQKLFSRK